MAVLQCAGNLLSNSYPHIKEENPPPRFGVIYPFYDLSISWVSYPRSHELDWPGRETHLVFEHDDLLFRTPHRGATECVSVGDFKSYITLNYCV